MSGRMPVQGSSDELDRLALALNEMLDQIESLMAAMKEVSSNVAHDLKTPLTRIKARVEAALRSGSEADYRAALESTVDDSDRLLDTFNALLSIARAEAGQSRSGLAPLDASSIIADVVELYEPMAEEEGGTLTCKAAPGLNVLGDRQLLAQALTNLLDNALKYGAREGETPQIAVTGAIEGDKVVITVADHGEGIPPEDRGRVTERFVRLDSSRTQARQRPGPEPRLRRHEAPQGRAAAGRQQPRPRGPAGAAAAPGVAYTIYNVTFTDLGAELIFPFSMASSTWLSFARLHDGPHAKAARGAGGSRIWRCMQQDAELARQMDWDAVQSDFWTYFQLPARQDQRQL